MDVNGGITEDHNSMYPDIATQAVENLNLKLEKHSKEKERPKNMIYRVHKHLRDINCNAYEPNVISIGPYHRGKAHLKRMEDHKLLSLQKFVERERIDITKLVDVLRGVALKARKCYADQDFKLSESEFIEMLVVDGCFIIELLLQIICGEPGLKLNGWMIYSLQRDLMLFENQVPFFVLRKLFKLIRPSSADSDLVYLLSYFFNNLYPGSAPSPEEVELRSLEVAQQGSEEIMHILDLIHRNWLPRKSQKQKEEKSDTHSQETRHIVLGLDCVPRKSRKSEVEESDNIKRKGKKEFEMIYSATRLTEANVKFEVKKEATSLFDIKFEDGTMAIPPLRIDDRTECSFRNLIAYEQYLMGSPHQLVTQYMDFLDNLINSSKDVEILSRNRIITNCQGNDEVVANMVNRLSESITYGLDMYDELFEAVNEHCRKPKNKWITSIKKWMAILWQDYLNSPWRIISIIAAVVLLGLTVVQTVFTKLQVDQQK